VLVGEVGLPIYQANYFEAELEGCYSGPTDTLAAVKLQALQMLSVSFLLGGRQYNPLE
jgi:hypothetical protein